MEVLFDQNASKKPTNLSLNSDLLKSKSTRKAYPYIVDIQSPAISDIATRIVVHIGRMEGFGNEQMQVLTSEINYEGVKLSSLNSLCVRLSARHSAVINNPN